MRKWLFLVLALFLAVVLLFGLTSLPSRPEGAAPGLTHTTGPANTPALEPAQTPGQTVATLAVQPGEPASTPASAENPTQAGAPSLHIDRDISYGPEGEFRLVLDVYYLAPFPVDQVRPGVVLIHGGGWESGSKEDLRLLGEELAGQGYVAYSISYRLTTWPDARFPAQLDDVQRAVRWVRANAAMYSVDPARVGAMGFSAGGHLAAFLGVADTHNNSDPELADYSSRAACVVDVFGPTDLTVDPPEETPGSSYITRIVTRLLGEDPTGSPELLRSASPIYYIDEHTVPFLIFHGSADTVVPVDQSRRFYQALLAAGVEVEYIEFEGEGHRFERPENQLRFYSATHRFLDGCLK